MIFTQDRYNHGVGHSAGHSILKASGGNIFNTNGLELYYGKNNFKNDNFIAFHYKNFPLSKYF